MRPRPRETDPEGGAQGAPAQRGADGAGAGSTRSALGWLGPARDRRLGSPPSRGGVRRSPARSRSTHTGRRAGPVGRLSADPGHGATESARAAVAHPPALQRRAPTLCRPADSHARARVERSGRIGPETPCIGPATRAGRGCLSRQRGGSLAHAARLRDPRVPRACCLDPETHPPNPYAKDLLARATAFVGRARSRPSPRSPPRSRWCPRCRPRSRVSFLPSRSTACTALRTRSAASLLADVVEHHRARTG